MNQPQQQHTKQKYALKGFSDQEMVRDWTLSEEDKHEISKYPSAYQAFIAA